jgi:hypothetical protein
MSELRQISVRISDTQADETGSEEIAAIIRNDFAKDNNGQPIYDKEFSYLMEGIFLPAPIPKEIRGGFKSAEEAEKAARQEIKEWRSGNIPPNTQVTRQEYWDMKYYSDPYLRDLSTEEFNERHAIVMNNMLTLTEERQLGIVPMDTEGDYWATAYAHILAESRLRGGFQGKSLKNLSHPDFNWVGIDKVSQVVQQLNLQKGKFLVKYGKEEHIKDAFEKGKIRISPANYYNDSSLNRAIQDDELKLSIRLRHKKNEALERFPNDLQNPVPSVGSVIKVLEAPTNYYVYCMASEFSLRLFPDFEADACLIIRNPEIFINHLRNAVLEQLPGWASFAEGVKYIDPVNTTESEVDIFYAKDFKYTYQKEYRVFWRPLTPIMKLDYLYIELGNLSDYCELIFLRDLS